MTTENANIKWNVTPDTLKADGDFQKWKFVLKQNFMTSVYTRKIFRGTVEITADGSVQSQEGSITRQEEDKFFAADAAMKALLVNSLDRKYASQVLHLETFREQWEKIENVVVGEKATRQVLLMAKIRQARWKGNMTQLVGHFRSLCQEYKSVGGQLGDTELVNLLLDKLPTSYNSYKMMLRKESIQMNEGNFELEETLKMLTLTEVEQTTKNDHSNNDSGGNSRARDRNRNKNRSGNRSKFKGRNTVINA